MKRQVLDAGISPSLRNGSQKRLQSAVKLRAKGKKRWHNREKMTEQPRQIDCTAIFKNLVRKIKNLTRFLQLSGEVLVGGPKVGKLGRLHNERIPQQRFATVGF